MSGATVSGTITPRLPLQAACEAGHYYLHQTHLDPFEIRKACYTLLGLIMPLSHIFFRNQFFHFSLDDCSNIQDLFVARKLYVT